MLGLGVEMCVVGGLIDGERGWVGAVERNAKRHPPTSLPKTQSDHVPPLTPTHIPQDKAHLEGSDKIFLPPSALDTLARLHIDYPMLFQVSIRTVGGHIGG